MSARSRGRKLTFLERFQIGAVQSLKTSPWQVAWRYSLFIVFVPATMSVLEGKDMSFRERIIEFAIFSYSSLSFFVAVCIASSSDVDSRRRALISFTPPDSPGRAKAGCRLLGELR